MPEGIPVADADQQPSKPSLPDSVWIVPALVVVGNLGYLLWLNQTPVSLSRLGPVLLFVFLIAPLSVLFLAVYAAAIRSLRRSPRPRRALGLVGLSALVALGACAFALGLVVGVLRLEAALGPP